MADRPKKWIIKDTEGRVRGPFPTEKVLYQIGRGELNGDESIAIFPGGKWFLISQEPQFYDRLIEVLAGVDQWEKDAEDDDSDSITTVGRSGRDQFSTIQDLSPQSEVAKGNDQDDGSFNLDKEAQQKVRGRAKRLEDPDGALHPAEKDAGPSAKKERRSRERKGDSSESIIELIDLGKLIKKEKFKQLRLPLIVGIIVISLGIFMQMKNENVTERIHLLHLQNGRSVIAKEQAAARFLRAQQAFAMGNFSSLSQAQNELVQIIEGNGHNAGTIALLCLTYFELWPYAYQDSKDLRAISLANQKGSSLDPGGQNSATCQVVDLLVRGRYSEAKSMTEGVLDTYSGTAYPPIPFYYFKAYLLSTGNEIMTAIGYVKSAQQLSPRWLEAYVLEGELQLKMGNIAEAAKIYQKILEQNPQHKTVKISLGIIEIKNFNHVDKGITLLNEALASQDLVPSQLFSKAYLTLAEVELNRHSNSRALELAQKAYLYNSNNIEAKNLILALGGKEKLSSTFVSSQQMVFEGDQFVREGDCNAAQAHYKTAFEIDKSNAIAALKAGQCLWQLSFSREAIDWLNRAIKSDSKMIDAYVLLADYFTQRYDFLSAARILAQAQHVAPKSYEVYRGYALVELRRGNPKGAIGYANKALAIYENDVETYILLARAYIASGDPTSAYKFAAKAIEIDINSREGQIEYARALAGTKGTEMGLEYLSKMINSYPLVSEYRMALGEMYLSDERYPEAIEVFRQVTEIEEKPKKAYLMLGKSQHLNGQIKEALESLLKSAVLDPADTEPLFEAGLLYLEIGKFNEARIQFERVLRINDRHPGAHYQIGRAALMMNNPKEALVQAEEERKINPNLADSYILGAEAYYKMNQHSLCAREYTKAIALRPQGADTYVKLARCYRLMGNFDMGENMLKTASKYDAGMPDIYRELGEIYLSRGEVEAAAETFNQYFQLNPGAQDRDLIQKRLEEVVRRASQ